MKRVRLPFLFGGLELASAATLLLIAWSLPGTREIARTFGSAQEMAQVSRQHLQPLEQQMAHVREGTVARHGVMQQFADTMTKLESLRYPVITLNGITPSVVWRQFLPRGAGQESRKIADATQAGVTEMDQLQQDLPRIHSSLQDMESVLAQYSRRTAAAMWYGRLLMELVAATISLHGTHLLLSTPRPILQATKATPTPLGGTC